MPRDVYYQSPGNPVQIERLPASEPTIELPHRCEKPKQQLLLIGKLAVAEFILGAAVLLLQITWTAWPQLHPMIPLILNTIVLVAFFAYALEIWSETINVRNYRMPLIAIASCAVYPSLALPLGVNLLNWTIAIGAFTWLFGRHWAWVCTASPVKRSLAEQLRRNWTSYLTAIAVFPFLLWLTLVFLGTWATLIVAVALAIFQIGRCLFAPWNAAKSLCLAVHSWFTYNHQESRVPGILRSPAGTWFTRFVVITVCIYLSAIVAGHILAEFAFNSSHEVRISRLLFETTARWSDALFDNDSWPARSFRAFTLVFLLISPALAPIVAASTLTLPLLLQAGRYRQTDVTSSHWATLVRDVQSSVDPTERQSVYVGRVIADGSPLLVPKPVFREHAHYLGDSGSGKTSQGLLPFIEQVASAGDCSVVVIDLKADSLELLATLQATAETVMCRTGREIPVKHFTTQIDRSTFAFSPFLQPFWKKLTLYQRTDILCGALGLTYGADYGEGYYSSANSAVLYHAIKTFPDVATFRESAERVGYVVANAKKRELHPEIRKAGVHVQTVLDRLGCSDPLNITEDNAPDQTVLDQSIDFTRVFTEPQLLYFHLSTTLGPGSAPEIARLIAYSLLCAATQTQRTHQVYLVIDEFQRMVARNLEYMLQLARSMGVGVILSNQSMQDLRTSTADLVPSIESNCRFRQWFSVSSKEDQDRLSQVSGETVDLTISQSVSEGPNGWSVGISQQEHILSRLCRNDILLASDHPKRSIVKISRGAGYSQYGGMPLVIESDYHITQDEYERRRSIPWPESVSGAFHPGHAQTSRTPKPSGPILTVEHIGSPPTKRDPSLLNPFESYLQAKKMTAPTSPRRRRKSP